MTCEPTQTPDAIDIPALREKYRQERDKRLRPEGQSQYLRTVDEFADQYEVDPHTPVAPRAPISEDLDVAILGAGWSGVMAAYRLKQAGVTTFRNIDLAGDFGGCWYWNRFPGLQCDNEAYCYIPLAEETGYMPTKKYVDGSEIYDHFKRIANQFGLYEGALFHTLVRALRWDENIKRWRLAHQPRRRYPSAFRGDGLRSPEQTEVAGHSRDQELQGALVPHGTLGLCVHGRHHRNPTLDKLADKHVALVGTGATAVQVVPYLGRYAKQLYVLQRTPSSVDKRPNPPTDPAWVKTLKPGGKRSVSRTFTTERHEALPRASPTSSATSGRRSTAISAPSWTPWVVRS